MPAGSRRYDPYRRHLAGLAWVPTRSRRSIRKEFHPAPRCSPSKPSAEARYVVNRKITPFPAGRKRFYNSGPIFPARRKRATRLAREDDKTSCPTPAAATVRPRAEVCSTDLSLRSAFRPPQPWKDSWHGRHGHDLTRAGCPCHVLRIAALTFVPHPQWPPRKRCLLGNLARDRIIWRFGSRPGPAFFIMKSGLSRIFRLGGREL